MDRERDKKIDREMESERINREREIERDKQR